MVGSAPPLEDCYEPERVPAATALAAEHAEHARHLAAAGVDAILIETMNTIREAVAAARAARARRLPFLVSFVCWRGATLLGGEPLDAALAAAAAEGAEAVLVNCLPVSNAAACLPALRAAGRLWLAGILVGLAAALLFAWQLWRLAPAGVTGADPYAYLQMALDLATNGSPRHSSIQRPRRLGHPRRLKIRLEENLP